MKRFLLTSLLALMAQNATSAQEADKLVVYVDFSNTEGSQFDPSMNKEKLNNLVRYAYSNSKKNVVFVDTKPVGVPYVQINNMHTHIEQNDVRFSSIVMYSRNKNGLAICDVHTAFWWLGPSGGNKLNDFTYSQILDFNKTCGI